MSGGARSCTEEEWSRSRAGLSHQQDSPALSRHVGARAGRHAFSSLNPGVSAGSGVALRVLPLAGLTGRVGAGPAWDEPAPQVGKIRSCPGDGRSVRPVPGSAGVEAQEEVRGLATGNEGSETRPGPPAKGLRRRVSAGRRAVAAGTCPRPLGVLSAAGPPEGRETWMRSAGRRAGERSRARGAPQVAPPRTSCGSRGCAAGHSAGCLLCMSHS